MFSVWENLKYDYPSFKKILSERIGDKPYFKIFAQGFVPMDGDTHPQEDNSG